MAISIDGFIAKKNHDSDWVSEVDSEIFEAKIKKARCLIVGRKTFEQYKGELYPMAGVLNVVLTNNKSKLQETKNIIITNKSPKDIVKYLEGKGFKEIIVIGGGNLNASFLKENLIDEIFLSIHPLILGDGIKLFENIEKFVELRLLEVKKLKEDLIQLHYKVKK